jgi:hypothetical protein
MGYAVGRKDIKMMCQEKEDDVNCGGKQKTEFLVD